VIVTLWQRTDRGMRRMHRLHPALAILPMAEPGGPLRAFSSMVRLRTMRPHTLSLSMIRVETP
jgi:hypothetical protein